MVAVLVVLVHLHRLGGLDDLRVVLLIVCTFMDELVLDLVVELDLVHHLHPSSRLVAALFVEVRASSS